MIKRGKSNLALILSLILIPFTSAYGGYSTFSIAQFTNTDTILTAILFLIIFYGVKKALDKALPNSNAASTIVSLVLSIFMVLGLNKLNFSLGDFLYTKGINEQLILSIAPWIFLFFIMITFWKFGLGGMLMILGGLFMVWGFVGMADQTIVYNWEVALGIGAVLFILGAILKKKGFKLPGMKLPGGIKGPNLGNIKNPLKSARLTLVVEGKRYYFPVMKSIPLTIESGKMSRIFVENSGSKTLIWKIKTKSGLRLDNTRGTLDPKQSVAVKVYSDSGKNKKLLIAKGGNLGKAYSQRIFVKVYHGKISDLSSESTPRPTKNRKNSELQKKYNYYSKLIQTLQKNNNGKVPAMGTKEGKLRKRYVQAMKVTENLARKNGFTLASPPRI